MNYIVTYDIGFAHEGDKRAQKRLRLVLKLMRRYGHHRQRSIFECVLDKKLYQRMIGELKKTIQVSTDSVRVYPLCDRCTEWVVIQGIGKKLEVKEYEII